MTTIRHELPIAAPAETAWALLKQTDRADRLFSPVLTDCTMQDDIRIVTFAAGLVASERIITVDDGERRLAYCVLGDMFEHHSASMQVIPVDDENCRFIWISDFLPDGVAETVQPLITEGAAALVHNIEVSAARR